MIEAFGAGTAAIVAPIKCIGYRDAVRVRPQDTTHIFQDYTIPLDADNPQAGAGKLAKRLANEIMSIQVLANDFVLLVLTSSAVRRRRARVVCCCGLMKYKKNVSFHSSLRLGFFFLMKGSHPPLYNLTLNLFLRGG